MGTSFFICTVLVHVQCRSFLEVKKQLGKLQFFSFIVNMGEQVFEFLSIIFFISQIAVGCQCVEELQPLCSDFLMVSYPLSYYHALEVNQNNSKLMLYFFALASHVWLASAPGF